jgi:methyl-accepting chemotaxis protein
MAEISLIASVVQVAGAGLKLADTLYQYADSVSSADKRIRDIAKDVKLTSSVIEELGSIFKQDETASLLSKNAVSTAEETVLECSTLFEEMDVAIKKTKNSALGSSSFHFESRRWSF